MIKHIRAFAMVAGFAPALTSGAGLAEAQTTPYSQKCKAVLPLGVVTKSSGFVNVDGTLLLDGENQCVLVNIECRQDLKTCLYSFSDISPVGDMPLVSRIVKEEYPIIKWSQQEVVAAGEAGLCGWVEIYINLTKQDTTITSTISTARPGCADAAKNEFFKSLVNDKTRVFHVGSDPYWKSRGNK
jgi:hypothetical protein